MDNNYNRKWIYGDSKNKPLIPSRLKNCYTITNYEFSNQVIYYYNYYTNNGNNNHNINNNNNNSNIINNKKRENDLEENDTNPISKKKTKY